MWSNPVGIPALFVVPFCVRPRNLPFHSSLIPESVLIDKSLICNSYIMASVYDIPAFGLTSFSQPAGFVDSIFRTMARSPFTPVVFA